MNQSEAKALDWLCKTTGFERTWIKFRGHDSPDFELPGGIGYEVKLLVGKTIQLDPKQWQKLLDHPNCKILVWGQSNEPIKIIPMTDLPLGTKEYEDIKISNNASRAKGMPREEYLRVLSLYGQKEMCKIARQYR